MAKEEEEEEQKNKSMNENKKYQEEEEQKQKNKKKKWPHDSTFRFEKLNGHKSCRSNVRVHQDPK